MKRCRCCQRHGQHRVCESRLRHTPSALKMWSGTRIILFISRCYPALRETFRFLFLNVGLNSLSRYATSSAYVVSACPNSFTSSVCEVRYSTILEMRINIITIVFLKVKAKYKITGILSLPQMGLNRCKACLHRGSQPIRGRSFAFRARRC